MRYKAIVMCIIAPVLLAGQCSSKATVTGAVCPRIKSYSAEMQNKALAEIDQIERNAPTLVVMFGDYLALRDAVRACVKKATKK
jgi:hypothetical protein